MSRIASDLSPAHVNPALWQQSMGLARQSCARIFRDGGRPADALKAFGIRADADKSGDWSRVVTMIAEQLSATPVRRAA